MKEIVKKILEVVGSKDIVFVGMEEQAGIKTIKPDELELYPKKFENIIVDDIEQLDEEKMKKLAEMSDCVWVLFSIDKFIRKIDSSIEDMIEKGEFKNVDIEGKIGILKNLMKGNAYIANFNLPDLAIAISKERGKIPGEIKSEPLTSFFLNLSMVEYLKSKLEEVKREKELIEKELEREKEKNRFLNNELEKMIKEREIVQARLEIEKKEIIKEKDALAKEIGIRSKKFEHERRNAEKRWRREITKMLKERKAIEEKFQNELESLNKSYEEEKAKLQKEIEKINKEKDALAKEMEERLEEMKRNYDLEKKAIEERFGEELKKIVIEMGLKLEEKERELKRLKGEE
jgi:flagellar capping protein FliD